MLTGFGFQHSCQEKMTAEFLGKWASHLPAYFVTNAEGGINAVSLSMLGAFHLRLFCYGKKFRMLGKQCCKNKYGERMVMICY